MFKDPAGSVRTNPSEVRVLIGDHELGTSGETSLEERELRVSTITNHEDYRASSAALYNDVSVITLSEELDLGVYTPACLAKTTDTTTFDNKTAQVYGWGTTSYGGSPSNKLLEANVTVVTNANCSATLGGSNGDAIYEGHLCAGDPGRDACQGDSGGPLTMEIDGQHVLIGDVSYGEGCAKNGTYGVYGRISYFRTWIEETIRRQETKYSNPSFCLDGANQGG